MILIPIHIDMFANCSFIYNQYLEAETILHKITIFFPANSFTIDATTTARTIPVGGLDHVTFTVRSCDLVFVSLSTPELSETYFLVELSPERIHAHECDSDCDGAVGQSDEKDMTRAADFNCSATAISYW